MGYERNDRRYGYGRDNVRDPRFDRGRYDPDERGFFDRAGDEVRSWFGDEEAERRRRMDERYDERYDRERGYGDRTHSGYGYDSDRDRFASRTVGGYRSPDRYPTWSRSNASEGYSGGYAPSSRSYPATGEDRQFEGGYPGDGSYGRRSYADTGYRYGGDDFGRTSSEDYRAAYGRRGTGYGQGRDRDEDRTAYGQGEDVHGYRNWRDSQIHAFDRDYDEYRRENQSRFQTEFAGWRQNRQTQRDSLNSVKEHQEVLGSDGAHVGTVDHVRGDRILLTKNDKDAGGHHHSIPSSWIAKVADKVTLSKTAAQAQQAWRDEETNRGLFGRDGDDDRDHGRSDLDRSFSGTY